MSPSGAQVTLEGIILSHGKTNSGNGGGVKNDGDLTLRNCIVTENVASDCWAFGDAGGIWNTACATGLLTLVGSTVTGNLAKNNAGAIENEGTLVAYDSNITQNFCGAAAGRPGEFHLRAPKTLTSLVRGSSLAPKSKRAVEMGFFVPKHQRGRNEPMVSTLLRALHVAPNRMPRASHAAFNAPSSVVGHAANPAPPSR